MGISRPFPSFFVTKKREVAFRLIRDSSSKQEEVRRKEASCKGDALARIGRLSHTR